MWGYHSDLNTSSECLRCLGGKRFEVCGWYKSIGLLYRMKKHQCKLMWTKDEEAAANIPPLDQEIDNSEGKWKEYSGGIITFVYQNN